MISIANRIKYFDNFCFECGETYKSQEFRVGDLSYVVIDNFFSEPDIVRDNFLNIPFDSGQNYLESLYKDDTEGDSGFIKFLGANQLIDSNLCQKLSMSIIDVLRDYDYIPQDSTFQNDVESLNRMMGSCNYQSNFFFPDMTINKNVQKAHPSPNNYNFTVFLGPSEGSNNGISFYNFEHENRLLWSLKDVFDDVTDVEERREIMDLLEYKYLPSTKYETFSNWSGDEYFKKVTTVESKYNRMIIYSGDYWTQHNYDNQSEKYIVTGSINIPKPGESKDLQAAELTDFLMGAPDV
jgi:hypothetical protein